MEITDLKYKSLIPDVRKSVELMGHLQSLLEFGPQNDAQQELITSLSDEVIQICSATLTKIKSSKNKNCLSPTRGVQTKNKDRNSWTKITAAPFHDGHLWRKYGEKKIYGSNFPRCYYRCTYREDQACQASKQVQLHNINEEQSSYLVTYKNKHTCKTSSTNTSNEIQLHDEYSQATTKPFSILSFCPNAMEKKKPYPKHEPQDWRNEGIISNNYNNNNYCHINQSGILLKSEFDFSQYSSDQFGIPALSSQLEIVEPSPFINANETFVQSPIMSPYSQELDFDCMQWDQFAYEFCDI